MGRQAIKYCSGFTLKLTLLAALSSFFISPNILSANQSAPHKNLGNEVIYQIVLDRFFDGNSQNNVFPDDPKGLFDSTKKHPMARFGGDIDGLIQKLPYLVDLGVTILWISPVIQNANELIPEAKGDLRGEMNSNYHGYWGDDWFSVDRHLEDQGERGFDAVSRLVDAANRYGIKIVIDTVINHSNNWDYSKGKLYKDGVFITDKDLDAQKLISEQWYHHLGVIPLDADVNQMDDRRFTDRLANLSDFNIEGNDAVMDYFVEAHKELLKSGVYGFRVDTIPYVQPSALKKFEDRIKQKYPETPMIGEWFAGGPTRTRSMGFYSYTGYTMFDFDLRWVFEKGFVGDTNYGYRTFNWLIDSVSAGFADMQAKGLDPNDMVNFVDNHDLPRLRDMGTSRKGIEAAYAMLFAMPGIPCIYYGDEQDLYDGSGRKGMGYQVGGDPFNRPMMNFAKDDQLKEKMKDFIEIRKKYDVLRYGNFENLDGQLKRTFKGRANVVSDKFGFISSCGRDRNYGFVREDRDYLAFYFTNVGDEMCTLEMKLDLNANLIDSVYSNDMQKPLTGDKSLAFSMGPFDYLTLIYKKNNPNFIFSKK